MTDNKDKDHIDKVTNEKSTITSAENVPAKKTAIFNPNPEATNMEVHKHPHHITHKKKWGEYILEFTMLFLAVFLGFIAENIREHKVENDRAKEFAKSLVQDLQNDTTAINTQVESGEIYIGITDSLLNLNVHPLEGRNASMFSFYTRFLYWTAPLSWNRATFEQIKNSGSLRYFKNYRLLEKLMKYNGLVNQVEGEFNNHQIRGNLLLAEINKIIDPEIHHLLSKYRLVELDTMTQNTKENYFSMNTVPLENKRTEISEMLNMSVVQQRNLRFNNARLLRTKALASELINDLQKEYDIE